MTLRVPHQLVTDRLLLRPAVPGDATAFRELWTERDPRVPPHRKIDADGHPSVEDIAVRLQRNEQPGVLTVTLRADGDVIGYCGLLFEGRGTPEEPELAYELLRRAHGLGYATEAAGAVVSWAADHGYRRLRAGVRTWNTASRNVLRKIEFVESGIEPDPEFGDTIVTVRTLPG